MKSWIVYMIRCEDNSLYTGCTNDLMRRWNEHIDGKGAKYTKSHKPLKLEYTEKHPDRSSAQKREYEIKQLNKKQKESLIDNY